MDDLAEAALIERLRAGDEEAFSRVFEQHQGMLMRLAFAFLKDPAAAEEVVQDTWVAVIDGLGSFEGRSTFKTWVARIAINRAKTRAVRDGRSPTFSELEPESGEPAVDPSRFYSWGLFNKWPDRWVDSPEELLSRQEVRVAIDAGLADLPDAQRAVVTLRDIEGWSSEEVCNALQISESNQRVLLHRGRSRLRVVLERVLQEGKNQ